MTQWVISDIMLYEQLAKTIDGVAQQLPSISEQNRDCLEQLRRDIEVDLKESIDQLSNLSKEDHEEKSRLNQKIETLKGLLSQTDMMLSRFRNLEGHHTEFMKLGQKAQSILNTFSQLGSSYLKLRAHGGSNVSNNKGISQNKMIKGVRLLGDTFHFSKQNNLSQLTLQSLENDIKNSPQKGNKISIDKVSQSDFDLLEKNGYTIQQIRANEFSAYKTISN
ncbi:MAG: hypothetical protein LW688_04220 [Cryomorphaceae bacterium]|jgi:hypothetical protein|nr:hypothetical protein [Cryomorphaceae bacterium]